MRLNKHQITSRSRQPDGKGGTLLAVGAALAATALIVRWKAAQAERKNPPQGNFVIIDGVRLHYTDRGEGQPVVLLHGNGALIEDFNLSGVVGLAAASYRVITFDRPGFGYSERPRSTVWTPAAQAELLVKALKQLQIEKPVVVGHSWGTMVAMSMGLDHPDYVRSLVLLSGFYYPTVRLDVPMLSIPAIPVLGTLMRHTVSPLLSRLIWPGLVKRIFSPSAVPHTFRQFPTWMALRPSQLRAAAADTALMIPAAFSMRKRYGSLKVPAVIMAGDGEKIVDTDKQSARLHRDLQHSELHLIPATGHMIHHLMPLEVLNAIDTAARTPDQLVTG
jgi:pimeloyl-ACP methyl ester carboxylesterase